MSPNWQSLIAGVDSPAEQLLYQRLQNFFQNTNEFTTPIAVRCQSIFLFLIHIHWQAVVPQ